MSPPSQNSPVNTLILATAYKVRVCLPLAGTPGKFTWPARHSDVLPQRGLATGRDARGPLASLSCCFRCGCRSGRLAEGVHVGRVSRVARPCVLGRALVRERVGGWASVSVSNSILPDRLQRIRSGRHTLSTAVIMRCTVFLPAQMPLCPCTGLQAGCNVHGDPPPRLWSERSPSEEVCPVSSFHKLGVRKS